MPQAGYEPVHANLRAAIRAVLEAAAPGPALLRAWSAAGPPGEPAIVVAVGKASVAMADMLVRERLVPVLSGIVIKPPGVPTRPALLDHAWRVFDADHPLPTQRNLIAAQAVADAARAASARRTPMVLLISGGASAYLTVPDRGLTLSDIRVVTDALLKAGAPITELNSVRSRCERLKGGGLARIAAPARLWAFILSDVLGDPVPLIGSGPTADDGAGPERALDVIDRRLGGAGPKSESITRIRAHIASGAARPPVTNSTNTIIAGSTVGVAAGAACLRSLGCAVESRSGVEGEASDQGRAFASRLLGVAEDRGPAALVWGGETTVTVRGAGFGGRNQEAALGAAQVIDGHIGVAIACLATDGVDGLSPPGRPVHAGAMVDGSTGALARSLNLDLAAVFERSDSYNACADLGVALCLGPTGTNVNDVWLGAVGTPG